MSTTRVHRLLVDVVIPSVQCSRLRKNKYRLLSFRNTRESRHFLRTVSRAVIVLEIQTCIAHT